MPTPGITPPPPIAPGQEQLNALAEHGFTASEIQAYKTRQEQRLVNGGFSADDIDKYWGAHQGSPVVADFVAGNVQQHLAVGQPAPPTWMDYVSAGFQHSVAGLVISHGRDTKLSIAGKGLVPGLLYSVGQMGGDLPWAYGGAVGGTAAGGGPEDGVGILTGGFGAGAFPEASRQTLLAAANAGQIHSWQDALQVASTGSWETLKQGSFSALGMRAAGPVGGAVLRSTGSEAAGTAASLATNAAVTTTASSAASGRLPTWQDYTLAATTMLAGHAAGIGGAKAANSEAVARVRTNMQRVWGATGIPPEDQVHRAQSDPMLRQELLQQDVQGDPTHPHWTAQGMDEPPPLVPHPPGYRGPTKAELMGSVSDRPLRAAMPTFIPSVDNAMGLLRKLEGSSDNAVSPAGAVGRFQIMPGTARQYGFDPARLKDPAYNETAARVIVSDLYRRYNGNMDAIAIAYNAGPGRANAYLTKGPGSRLEAVLDPTQRGGVRYVKVEAAKDESFLPLETQRYLANGRRRAGQLSPEEGKGGEILADNERPDGRPIPSWEAAQRPESIERLNAEVETPKEGEKSLSAAEVWPSATDDDLVKATLENVGERPKSSITDLASPDRLLTHFFSELQPARQIDNQLVREGLMNRTTDFGAEDALRQTYASDARTGVWVRYGQIDSPETKNIVEGSSSLLDAVRAMKENGGDPDGFRAYLLNQRTVQKSTEYLDQAKVALRLAEAEAAEKPSKQTEAKVEKARAALEKITSGEADEGINTGFNPFVAKEMVKRDSFNAKYAEAARIWTEVNNSVLDYAVQAGRYSPEAANAMKALNTTYVSMRRIMGDDASFDSPHTSGFTIGSPLKRMEGSDRSIVDPIAATIDNMRMLVKSADQNWARGRIIELAKANPEIATSLGLREKPAASDPNDDQIEEALKAYGFRQPDPKENDPDVAARWEQAKKAYTDMIAERLDKGLGDNEFTHFENGERHVYQIANRDFANLLKGSYSRGTIDLATKTLQTFAAGARTGIVIMPDFPGRSALSHQVIQFINDPLHPPPVFTWMRGITHVLGVDDVYQDAVAKGAMGSAMVEMDRDHLAYDMDHLFEETGAAERVWNQVKHPLQLAQLVSERIDAANRVGYTLHAESKGIDPLKAATQARKAGIDYAEKATASWVNWYSSITPFFRPKLLYMKNFAEAVSERPAETLAYAAMTVAVPTAIAWALNNLQDQTQFKSDPGRQFANIPRWEKDYAIITPEIAGQRFKLRFPEGSGAIFGSMFNRVLDAMFKHDPEAMHKWSDFILQQLPLSAPAMVQAPLEALTNHHLATGAPLIPVSLQGDSPQLQYTDNTTAVSKAIARLIDPALQRSNVSGLAPIQIDHMIQGWTGTAGLRLLHLVSAPVSRPGPPMDVADIPFVQGFVIRNPGANAQAIQDYYDTKTQFDQALADLGTTRRNARGGNLDDLAYVQKEYAYAEADRRLNGVSHALGLMRSSLWGIYADKKMTVDEKRQHIENVYNQMIDLSKEATKEMRQFETQHPR